MSRVDKIIDLIDVGLQTPMPDPTYGEVSPVNRESCFRCNRPPEDGSDMCAGCRSFMLGDSEDDPAERPAVHGHGIPEVSGADYARQSTAWTTVVQRTCGNPRCNELGHLHVEFRW